MDKEKEIQAIVGILRKVRYGAFVPCSEYDERCADCYEYRHDIPCGFLTQAEILYNAGYRKADEVRKKTAKEILQELYDITFEMKDPYNGDIDEAKEVIDRAEILHTAKMYGVEVDE